MSDLRKRFPPDKLDVLQKYWVEAEAECDRLRTSVTELQGLLSGVVNRADEIDSLRAGVHELETENARLQTIITEIANHPLMRGLNVDSATEK